MKFSPFGSKEGVDFSSAALPLSKERSRKASFHCGDSRSSLKSRSLFFTSSPIQERPIELQRALEYINRHLEGSLPLEELVRYSGVSRATLHRQFRKYLKTSPINYFLDQKLERAKMLLENNLCSIKEIAEQFHYASAQYFSHEFKKKYGMPPKHCKLRIRS